MRGYEPILAILLFSCALALHSRQVDLKLRLDYLWAVQVSHSISSTHVHGIMSNFMKLLTSTFRKISRTKTVKIFHVCWGLQRKVIKTFFPEMYKFHLFCRSDFLFAIALKQHIISEVIYLRYIMNAR